MDDPTRMPSAALAPVDEDADELLWRMTVAEQVAGAELAPLDDDGPTQPERIPWTIESDDDAEWALARLAETEAGLAAVIAHVEAQKARAEEWADRVVNERRVGPGGRRIPSLLESRRILTAHLEWYGRRQREDKERATVDLISGAVKTRATNKGGAVVIEDPAKVLEWAKGNAPDMVKVDEVVQVSTLRKWVSPTPEGKLRLEVPTCDDGDVRPAVVLDAIPGVSIEPEGLNVTVTPTPPALER